MMQFIVPFSAVLVVVLLMVFGVLRRRHRQEQDRLKASLSSSRQSYDFFEEEVIVLSKESGVPSVPPSSSVSKQTPPQASEQRQDDALLALYLVAEPGRPYLGYSLLQSLLAVDLRFGAMNIFHRFAPGTENILFSVASATPPGTFDLQRMGTARCQGLCFVLRLNSELEHPSEVLQAMVDTALQLYEDLGGRYWTIASKLLMPVRLRDTVKKPSLMRKRRVFRACFRRRRSLGGGLGLPYNHPGLRGDVSSRVEERWLSGRKRRS